jgi:hypothetical protein
MMPIKAQGKRSRKWEQEKRKAKRGSAVDFSSLHLLPEPPPYPADHKFG